MRFRAREAGARSRPALLASTICACEWSGRPASGVFMTFDVRLAAAARREGFEVPEPSDF
ncbi:MAG: hypothetical protein ACC682_16315 [Gemmatimonadota bacterium]